MNTYCTWRFRRVVRTAVIHKILLLVLSVATTLAQPAFALGDEARWLKPIHTSCGAVLAPHPVATELARAQAILWIERHVMQPTRTAKPRLGGTSSATVSFDSATAQFVATEEMPLSGRGPSAESRLESLTSALAGSRPPPREVIDVLALHGPGVVSLDTLRESMFSPWEPAPLFTHREVALRRGARLFTLASGLVSAAFFGVDLSSFGIASGALAIATGTGLEYERARRAQAQRATRPAGALGALIDGSSSLPGMVAMTQEQNERWELFRTHVLDKVRLGEEAGVFVITLNPWVHVSGSYDYLREHHHLHDYPVDLLIRPLAGRPGEAEVLFVVRRHVRPYRMF